MALYPSMACLREIRCAIRALHQRVGISNGRELHKAERPILLHSRKKRPSTEGGGKSSFLVKLSVVMCNIDCFFVDI